MGLWCSAGGVFRSGEDVEGPQAVEPESLWVFQVEFFMLQIVVNISLLYNTFNIPIHATLGLGFRGLTCSEAKGIFSL